MYTEKYRLSYAHTECAGGVWSLQACDYPYSPFGPTIALPQSSSSTNEYEKNHLRLASDDDTTIHIQLLRVSAEDLVRNYKGLARQLKLIIGDRGVRTILKAEFARDKEGYHQCAKDVEMPHIDHRLLQLLAEGNPIGVDLFTKACASIA